MYYIYIYIYVYLTSVILIALFLSPFLALFPIPYFLIMAYS